MPVTKYKARIADVDGDGRDDTEWALEKSGGTIEFGVTTASGATISASEGYASGGGRSVSIGTLATGQTVALPTDGHVANLYVLHDCRWIEPTLAGTKHAFYFSTAYDDPPGSAGGVCEGGRLYQVYANQTKVADHFQVSGAAEDISASGASVSTGATVVLNPDLHSDASGTNLRAYGNGTCQPSMRLTLY